MAQAAVSFLLGKIDNLVGREWDLLISIDGRVDNLRHELESMTALLTDADARGEQDSQFRVWIQQVRDLAYAIDNVLDTFILHLVKHPPRVLNVTQLFTRFNVRHLIGNQILEINTRWIALSRPRKYNAMLTPSGPQASSSSNSGTGNDTFFTPRIESLYVEEADIVGIEEPKSKLTSWALDQGSPMCKVMFVVGMGGSGKTALVKKVYESIKAKFDCHAWIIVSRSKRKLEFLWGIFNRLGCPTVESSAHFNEVDLLNELSNHLRGKRYVIVLDDLWVKDVWESIRCALPKDTMSRIIITTRRGDIANSCSDSSSIDVHEVQPLQPEKAQELFYKKAFPPSGICPPGLVYRSKSILEKCEGLPLGIIEIGKFLSNKEKTESEWKRLHDGLESELKREGRLSRITRVLSLSYTDLPYHLKYCFLYFSNFPGVRIKRRTLIRLWIAEGFIRRDTGKELEDIGEEYLKELIDRSLIRSESDFDGRPRLCWANNLMHKIILSKASDENFSTVFKGTETNLHGEKTRRLSIQKGGFNMSQEKFPVGRALFMFESETPTPYRHKLDIPSNMQLLKVLHLEGASNLDTFPSEITGLLLLTYLCLSHTRIKSIPKALGNLRDLETLDLKQTFVTKIPKKITKLAKLRHLLVHYYNLSGYESFDTVKGFEISKKISRLTNLQKLSFVKANKHLISNLGHLTQLRKLGIIDLSEAEGPILCNAIQVLQNLQSLNVTSLHKEEYLNLQEINNPPPLLQRLCLKGRLQKMPRWISKLHDLVRIRLKWSRLTHDPIPILQDLPNLLELQLLDAYTGTQLNFDAGKFQKLKILEFEQLEELEMVMLKSGSMPGLQKLTIRGCDNLKRVPIGIENLTHLKELDLYDKPHYFVSPLQKNGGALRHLVCHIPKIHSYYLNMEGYVDLS
ncbi:LOW QUALITY PROTEIN: disease resistance protein RPM1-like [Actinidia eriantha]|uniref:LOW QUALITY PROTEIN: disease resistance protein RPM1-like n=1 Tax=Actinidia eriantha TaxID=165200 RepID=UPI002583DE77|nr:LOW QUALITY PROTEIN: disease resistance protein RPM1-like [Actinidia eriantha]